MSYLFIFSLLLSSMCILPMRISYARKIDDIQQATSQEVSSCEFLGRVQGFSGWGKTISRQEYNKAKYIALEKAANLNATHIIWTRLPRSYSSPYAYGKAYNCDHQLLAND
ncbi:hypothetical protein [Candidatus Nitrosacidococcus sp. I8]|uniref:hypothetical protein n=1 Tax=Candidatus Nitrosacidococcus sp. I8 TaxID=2942908 RepID=UPI00222751A9|nr:hypothetical protein [Candidatus Nitrosacidococcus sp. I8]CAH9017858.1 hypothetical protein NURINAE_00593 [Candidatus Nitrosacidococcus sp. I8]